MGTEKRERQKRNRDVARQQQRRRRKLAKVRRRTLRIGLLLAVVVGIVFFASRNGDESADDAASTTSMPAAVTTIPGETISGDVECPPEEGSTARVTTFAKEPPMCIDTDVTYLATIETSMGTMVAELYPNKAPKTVNSFVVLARYRFYEGIIFHRIVKDFVIQGGDPEGTGIGGPGYEFADELPDANEYQIGSLAMANSGPDTNGSQFFIVTGPNGAALPPSYSLFGRVVEGLDVADRIQNVEVDGERPRVPVVIESVRISVK